MCCGPYPAADRQHRPGFMPHHIPPPPAGQLDGYTFGVDAVAAMPDVFRDYNTSCGRRVWEVAVGQGVWGVGCR